MNGGLWDPGRQPDNRRKCVAGAVAHQSVLIAVHLSLGQDWWYTFSASVLVETGLAQSATAPEVFFPHLFVVLQPITKFLNVNPSGCSGSYSRALACSRNSAPSRMLYAELIAELLLLSKKTSFFSFYFDLLLTYWCHVMLATSSSLSLHSIYVPRWSALSISSGSRITFEPEHWNQVGSGTCTKLASSEWELRNEYSTSGNPLVSPVFLVGVSHSVILKAISKPRQGVVKQALAGGKMTLGRSGNGGPSRVLVNWSCSVCSTE